MHRKMMFAMLAGAALSVLPSASDATPIASDQIAQGIVEFVNSSTNLTDGSAACFNSVSNGAAVGCSGSTTIPTTGKTLDYLTTATAGFGVLKAGGQSSITNANGVSNTTDYSTAYGSAYFDDSWTITGGTGTGTLELQFALDGSYNFCNGGAYLAFGLYNFDTFGSSSGTPSLGPTCSGTISNTVTLSTPFTFGTPVDFRVYLDAGSNLFNLGVNGSSDIDFSDTAQMNAIIVTNSSGAVIPFDLSTGSNAPLFNTLAPNNVPTNPVPEPFTLSLFGAGLAGAIAMRRRKKTNSSF